MTFTRKQIIEKVENLGGYVSNNKAYFEFGQSVSNDNNESITSKSAINIEKQMMDLGVDGALIGTEFNEGDDLGIYFNV
jgi:hypothetical protein